jgi:hypothetical protein
MKENIFESTAKLREYFANISEEERNEMREFFTKAQPGEVTVAGYLSEKPGAAIPDGIFRQIYKGILPAYWHLVDTTGRIGPPGVSGDPDFGGNPDLGYIPGILLMLRLIGERIDFLKVDNRDNKDGAIVIYEHSGAEELGQKRLYNIAYDPSVTDKNCESYAPITVHKSTTE